MEGFDEPDGRIADPSRLLIEYLELYRQTMLRKIDGLDDDQLRHTVLPSGWTPLELIKHLGHVERRWIQWGFQAIAVEDPWGDNDPQTGRWSVGPDESVDDLRNFLLQQGVRTTRVLSSAPLDTPAEIGGRFSEDPPTLGWIGFHLLQEYARHLGHLDVVRELIDQQTGE
ncbi:DinB family protein [Microlunatus elymi]|uniref:DinB family protein n=1 Tax=Microlunatus elymi TaxID=2596828 RepID=A0A516PUI2_9ACTN|nr:DinB family protein [Microlunatus elymi]QDP94854.1 DinB family protein [Microlunatus elymi]